jgi:hypothetical protein
MSEKLTLTKEELQELMAGVAASVAAEMKKPVITEEQMKEVEAAQDRRREEAANFQAMKDAEKNTRLSICTHSNRNGTSACVPVKNGDRVNFIICQHCQLVVKPDGTGEYVDEVLHDINTFNRMMIAINAGGAF